jgi:hypothetical protein
MVKIPKFLAKAGREKKAEKGRPVDKGTLFKWNHIGSVAKPMLQVRSLSPKAPTLNGPPTNGLGRSYALGVPGVRGG